MKVLHIPNYYYPHIGGIEQVARDCVHSLSGKCEQKVICFNHEKDTIKEIIDGIEVTRVGSFAKVASQSLCLHYKRELKKILKEFNPNVVIFHYPNPFVAYYLMRFLKKKSFKFILWWHLDITKQKLLGKLFNTQTKKLLSIADKIVVTSPNYLQGSKFLPQYKDKCSVIPCCVDDSRLKYSQNEINLANQIKQQNNDKIICFAFGRHVEYKGLTYLIQASKILTNDFKIYIGGSGPLTNDLKQEALNDEKIEFLGRLSDEDLKAYLLACDIFCFPSITKNEAFGIGLAEAMYYAKPSVTFKIAGSGVNYVSLNNVTGIEVENKNVEAYAKAIEALKDKSLRLKLGTNAYNRVMELFTFAQFKDNLEKLLEIGE